MAIYKRDCNTGMYIYYVYTHTRNSQIVNRVSIN